METLVIQVKKFPLGIPVSRRLVKAMDALAEVDRYRAKVLVDRLRNERYRKGGLLLDRSRLFGGTWRATRLHL